MFLKEPAIVRPEADIIRLEPPSEPVIPVCNSMFGLSGLAFGANLDRL